MGSFSDPQIVESAMAMALKPDFDLRESAGLLFGPIGAPETRYMPFEFVKANYDASKPRFPLDRHSALAIFCLSWAAISAMRNPRRS